MSRRRYIRFSLGTFLVVVTGFAVLLNHEIQRIKAIETTVRSIEGWNGKVRFRQRLPEFLERFLPEYTVKTIDHVILKVYTPQWPEASGDYFLFSYGSMVIEASELAKVVELGALDQMRMVSIQGTALKYDVASRICKVPSIEECYYYDVSWSADQIAQLKQAHPQCAIDVTQHTEASRSNNQN